MKHLGEELSGCNTVSMFLSHHNQRKNDSPFMQIPQQLALLNDFSKKNVLPKYLISLSVNPGMY